MDQKLTKREVAVGPGVPVVIVGGVHDGMAGVCRGVQVRRAALTAA